MLSQLYRVSNEQAAIVAKHERKLAMRRGRIRVPPGGKLVEEANGRFTVYSEPKTIAPGVTVTQSVSHHNVYDNDDHGARELGELETTRLTLIPIAIGGAIPTAAGLIVTIILGRHLANSPQRPLASVQMTGG